VNLVYGIQSHVYHKLVAEEAASAQTLCEANFDYSVLQSILLGVEREHSHASDSEHDDEENTQAALIAKGRITSTVRTSLQLRTGQSRLNGAYNIVRSRALNKELAAAAAKDKRDAREAAAREAHALVITHKAQI